MTHSDSTSDANASSPIYRPFFGGSPANIGMNADSLGLTSRIVSSVGRDRLGEFLLDYLRVHRMSTDMIAQVPEATSMVLLNQSQGTPSPAFYRHADYQLLTSDRLTDTVAHAKVLHFSSWPLSRQPSRATIESAIATAKVNNTLVCFDPNYHAGVWNGSGENHAQAVDYVCSIIAQADIIKPSEDDANRLFGDNTPQAHMERFLKLGVKLVVMTLGRDGVLVSNGNESLTLPTLATTVVNTTGAGDAFWSGLYAGIVRGHSISEAVQLGQLASRHKLQHLSSVADLPPYETLLQQLTTEEAYVYSQAQA